MQKQQKIFSKIFLIIFACPNPNKKMSNQKF